MRSEMNQEEKTLYVCSICGIKEQLGFYEAQRKGWIWKRRIGVFYDYYCPKHSLRK